MSRGPESVDRQERGKELEDKFVMTKEEFEQAEALGKEEHEAIEDKVKRLHGETAMLIATIDKKWIGPNRWRITVKYKK